MARKRKLSPIKVFLFIATLAILVFALSTYAQTLQSMSGVGTKLNNLDKTLIGAYLDLIRNNDIGRPISNDPTPQPFVVVPGETVTEIAANLQAQGLIRDAELFRLYVRFNGLDATINAGTFTLRSNMNIPEIAQALQRGMALEVQVTIPEGKRMEEVAELLHEQLGTDADEFLRLARRASYDYPFLKDLPEGSSLEGYLFPDTYRLPNNPTAQDVLLRMLDNYGAKVAPLMVPRADGMSQHQILTLASIVEREAVIPTERPVIASVYLNRLKIGMALQADPTTQYALGYQPDQKTWWKQGLSVDDLKYVDPSGYNTYINPELPPSPIANPGLSSIQAVITPAQTNYLYFVASCAKDGTHTFAASFAEHQANLCP